LPCDFQGDPSWPPNPTFKVIRKKMSHSQLGMSVYNSRRHHSNAEFRATSTYSCL
jgi:hypothetical protein